MKTNILCCFVGSVAAVYYLICLLAESWRWAFLYWLGQRHEGDRGQKERKPSSQTVYFSMRIFYLIDFLFRLKTSSWRFIRETLYRQKGNLRLNPQGMLLFQVPDRSISRCQQSDGGGSESLGTTLLQQCSFGL